jgi:fatty-acyl-CoA synthase
VNTNETLPAGDEGELCTRGDLVMKGYYKMPELTSQLVDSEDWFHTGDLATIDDRGYIRITGRLKDVIMPGGMNFAPTEVEDFLHGHPKVEQVSVVGVPDAVMGEIGMAFIKLKVGEQATQEEFIVFCKGRIANFKVPKYVKFVQDFPMTALGKIQKFVLRDQAINELNLGEK